MGLKIRLKFLVQAWEPRSNSLQLSKMAAVSNFVRDCGDMVRDSMDRLGSFSVSNGVHSNTSSVNGPEGDVCKGDRVMTKDADGCWHTGTVKRIHPRPGYEHVMLGQVTI